MIRSCFSVCLCVFLCFHLPLYDVTCMRVCVCAPSAVCTSILADEFFSYCSFFIFFPLRPPRVPCVMLASEYTIIENLRCESFITLQLRLVSIVVTKSRDNVIVATLSSCNVLGDEMMLWMTSASELITVLAPGTKMISESNSKILPQATSRNVYVVTRGQRQERLFRVSIPPNVPPITHTQTKHSSAHV